MNDKKKIYCFSNGGPAGWLHAVAIAEDGNVLAEHICSDEGFMRYDLGITSDRKHDLYNAHFGDDGWVLVWVDDPSDLRLLGAIELNQKLNTEGSGSALPNV
jgi:hypothetical protein